MLAFTFRIAGTGLTFARAGDWRPNVHRKRRAGPDFESHPDFKSYNVCQIIMWAGRQL